MLGRWLWSPLAALTLSPLAPWALGPAAAGEADVIEVALARETGGTWRFDVTVAHADAGWDHYADRFEILAGTVLGTRTLLHPHEHEQPFTRSLTGVVVPADLDRVRVRAHDSVHDHGGAEVEVALPAGAS